MNTKFFLKTLECLFATIITPFLENFYSFWTYKLLFSTSRFFLFALFEKQHSYAQNIARKLYKKFEKKLFVFFILSFLEWNIFCFCCCFPKFSILKNNNKSHWRFKRFFLNFRKELPITFFFIFAVSRV